MKEQKDAERDKFSVMFYGHPERRQDFADIALIFDAVSVRCTPSSALAVDQVSHLKHVFIHSSLFLTV